MGLELTSYLQAADDSNRTDSPAYHSELSEIVSLVYVSLREILYGLAIRIPGFHPGGPGSTPGMGTHILRAQTLQMLFLVFIKH